MRLLSFQTEHNITTLFCRCSLLSLFSLVVTTCLVVWVPPTPRLGGLYHGLEKSAAQNLLLQFVGLKDTEVAHDPVSVHCSDQPGGDGSQTDSSLIYCGNVVVYSSRFVTTLSSYVPLVFAVWDKQ